jgi:hypothetical protein
MLFVVALENCLIKSTKLHAHQAQALVFETGGDSADKATINGIVLEEDEGAF